MFGKGVGAFDEVGGAFDEGGRALDEGGRASDKGVGVSDRGGMDDYFSACGEGSSRMDG